MASADIIEKIKMSIRIKHHKLNEDIGDTIDACLADLKVCGVIKLDEEDPLIYNAVKLYCKSEHSDDPTKAEMYHERYDSLKACLMMAEGYGWIDEEATDG